MLSNSLSYFWFEKNYVYNSPGAYEINHCWCLLYAEKVTSPAKCNYKIATKISTRQLSCRNLCIFCCDLIVRDRITPKRYFHMGNCEWNIVSEMGSRLFLVTQYLPVTSGINDTLTLWGHFKGHRGHHTPWPTAAPARVRQGVNTEPCLVKERLPVVVPWF